ncbi:MAG: lipid-A-disaccharide synthase N-terminal domain-containing protein [Verrucomicrobia bacterium]|nr:lipid-A-disaccharide synthase N-terminal domain-containing protein [Verrucomicrobiota bacterium]
MHGTPLLFAAYLDNLLQRLQGGITFWTCFGLVGNVLFSSRFFVQWYVSEKRGQSVIPVSFWYLSLVGSLITSIYAIHLGSVPYILGVLPPTFIYARNLVLIARGKKSPPGTVPADAEVTVDPHAPAGTHPQNMPLAHPVPPPEEDHAAPPAAAAAVTGKAA